MKNIKVHYFEMIADLIFQKFNVLVYEIQKYSNKYRDYTIG